MVKTDPKRSQAKNFFLPVHQGTISQLFTKKKFPLHNPFNDTAPLGKNICFYFCDFPKIDHKKVAFLASLAGVPALRSSPIEKI